MKFRRLTALGRVSLLALIVAGCSTTPTPSEPPTVPTGSTGSSSQTGLPTQAPRGYTLDQGDLIAIQVFDEPDLTMEARVGASGVINYSYLGNVQVAGKSPQELEQHVATELRDGYLVNPAVNVTVLEYRPFYINGEVQSPGSYPYEPGLTLDKAIALAGGLTDRASTRRMYVIKGEGETQNQERVRFNSRIQPGDIISIEEGFF